MNYSFDVEVATEIGVDGAIMMQNLVFWLNKNIANNTNYIDGKYWTFNSIKAFGLLFPFWSEKQIRRILTNLIDNGYIETGVFNKSRYDRTKWYTLTEKGLSLMSSSILPNGQINFSKRANQNSQMGEPIPDINTDINTDKDVVVVDRGEPELGNCIREFEDNIHPLTGMIERDKIIELYDKYHAEWFNEAVKTAALNHGLSVSYVEAILKNWERNGFKAKKEGNNGRRFAKAAGKNKGGNGRKSAEYEREKWRHETSGWD